MKPKAIVFDAYGTLFDVNSAAEKCKSKIGNKWESFANFWRTTQLEYTWLRSLMKKHKNFWQVTEDSLDKSMKVFNIENGLKKELLDLYKILSPYPEVKSVLTNLKEKKFKLAILSNGTPKLLEELVRSNNLNNLFYNEEGVWKHSKLNKTAFSSLTKMEAFKSLSEFQNNTLENHKQMHDLVIDNYNVLKKGQFGMTKTAVKRALKKGEEVIPIVTGDNWQVNTRSKSLSLSLK